MNMKSITKRASDVFVASILLIIMLPILFLGSLTVLFSMGRPIFFLHERSGQYGKPFRMVKLRTMVNDQTGKLSDNERVTRAGLLLRKFSIDELPQLLNVLGGSMSLVGPRPLLREYDRLYSPVQARRLQVKPGLTGLAQVAGRNELSWDEKLELDIQYVDRQSLWLDFKIMLRTPMVVLLARGFQRSGELKKFGE